MGGSLPAYAVLALALLLPACEPKPASETAPGAAAARRAGFCAAGAVKDDGSVETGYGFVPTATDGEYVQEFLADELPSRRMDRVCVCWLKTRHEPDIDFEVVFYAAAGDGAGPAAEPYAVVPATATGLPESVAAAGRFFAVDVSAVTLEPGTAYIGARWDPSAAKYLFVCTDQSEGTAEAKVFFREDRRPRWLSAQDSPDPTFNAHRAILVRAEGRR